MGGSSTGGYKHKAAGDTGQAFEDTASGWKTKSSLAGKRYDFSRHRKRKEKRLNKAQDRRFADFEGQWKGSEQIEAQSNTNFEGLYGKDFADAVLATQERGGSEYTAGRYNEGTLERMRIGDIEGAANYIRSRRTISERLEKSGGFKKRGGGNIFTQKKKKTAFTGGQEATMEGGLYGG